MAYVTVQRKLIYIYIQYVLEFVSGKYNFFSHLYGTRLQKIFVSEGFQAIGLNVIIRFRLGKPQKKIFFSGQATKALPLPPLPFELSDHIFFSNLTKNLFSQWPGPYPPPLLVAGPLKNNFFCGFPYAEGNMDKPK